MVLQSTVPTYAVIPPELLRDEIADLVDLGVQVLTVVGTDDRHLGRGFSVDVAVLLPGGVTVRRTAHLSATDPRYPAITTRVPACHWDEREMRELLGIVPEGHPDSRRLILRDEWPDGVFPLRKDFDPSVLPPAPRHDSAHPLVVEDREIVQVPVGPIHAGIIEPGHFRFSAVGETILHLDAQLFYTHRGIEKVAEGRSPAGALMVAERTCGACAASHAAAFAMAVESIVEFTPPARANWARTIVLELERLYNHLGDAGSMCAGGAFALGTMTGAYLKEQVQQQNERLVGHRFLRGAIAVGGLRRDLPEAELLNLADQLRVWQSQAIRFRRMVMSQDTFVDRMRTTGIVSTKVARDLGGVGVLARASGLDMDIRRDRPYFGYPLLEFSVRTQSAGDAEARFHQRLDEADVSFSILAQLLAHPVAGPIRAALPALPVEGVGIGVVESPRGANTHWVRIGENGLVDRLRIRSASFPNWPIVPLSAPGNLVPDFPMINKSFELCYACLDR